MVSGSIRQRLAREQPLVDLLAVLLLLMVGIVGYKLSPAYRGPAELLLPYDASCRLHRGLCSVALPAGSIEVEISPRPVPVLQPLTVDIRTVGFEPQRIDVDFAGVGMAMGLNRPQAGQVTHGRYRAHATLPVCVSGGMEWEMRLLIDMPEHGQVVVPFRFTTPAPGSDAHG